ncbi:MAG: hypothetical protein K8T25_03660 [Planctomycetia bacterium]|nr:hypothetical protein [Planctomycetia bacterium]
MRLADAKWLQWLLGVDPASVPPDATAQFVFRNAPSSWAVFVLLGVVVILAGMIYYCYRRENDVCPLPARVLLAGLRMLVLLLLVGVYLDPAVYFNQRRVLEPTIWVLRDASQSMASPSDLYLDDRDANVVAAATGRSVEVVRSEHPTRATLVNDVLARDNQRLLRALAQRGRPQVMDFAANVEKVPLILETPAAASAKAGTKSPAATTTPQPMFVLPPLKAEGQATDLRRALQEGITDRFVAAVVAFTDGQHTVHEAESDDLHRVAESARQRGVPLLIVGVGDPTHPRNLQVTDIYANPQVWLQDPFEIQSTLRAEGISDESVEVSLIERQLGDNGAPEGPERSVDHRTVRIPAGTNRLRVDFTHTAPAAGRYTYTVRAAVLPNESNKQDNEPDAPVEVKVLNRRARVLLVSGGPTWEYQLLLRLLKRQSWCNLSSWLQTMDLDRDQEGTTVIRRLPRTREEMFQYDVIMLLDPDPAEFDEAWLKLLKEFVGDHAGGLLFMAGPKFSGRFLAEPKTHLIRDLLPVSLGDVARLDVEQLLDTNSRPWALGIVPSNVDHPIMRFNADPTRSLAMWQQLPGIFWSLPCDSAKPGARMLIERADSSGSQATAARPLLVTGLYGSGRIVFVGFNGTWRWRRMPNLYTFYKTFWEQTVKYLVDGRSAEGQRRVLVETERTRYTVGDRIAVSARLWTPAGTPLEQPRIVGTLSTPGSPPEQVELKPVANVPGQYSTTLVAHTKGLFELTLELPTDTAGTPPRAAANFSVTLPSVELERPWLNKPLLVELAKASGGRYFDLNELDQVAAAVPDRKQMITVLSKPVLVRDSSRRVLLFFLVGLLAVEWGFRKRFKLI